MEVRGYKRKGEGRGSYRREHEEEEERGRKRGYRRGGEENLMNPVIQSELWHLL